MPLKTHQDELPAINLTPMIDIVFQLIIFFMVGSQFTDLEQRVDVKVPQVAQGTPATPAPVKHVIHVYRDGRIVFDRRDVTLDELEAELAAARRGAAETNVVVRGDAEGAFQHVAAVLSACRHAGVSDLGISVRVAAKPR